MARDLKMLLKACAVRMYGDIGPLTVYSRKNRDLVFFARNKPHKPASMLQIAQRARFAAAMYDWRHLLKNDRDAWEMISLRTSVPYTGLNLFMMMELRPDMRTEIESYAVEAGFSCAPPFTPR